jgi:hypothetical protein
VAIQTTGRIGVTRATRGSNNEPFAQGDYGEGLISDFMPDYAALTQEGLISTLTLLATSTGVAAGNIVGAAAAAATQFGLINPATSGKNYFLTKFFMGIVSGTPGPGPIFHGYITNIQSLTAGSPGGTLRSNLLGGTEGSGAIPWSLAAGSALTGSTQAPITFRPAAFSSTATAQASPSEINCLELIDGDIMIPPGVMWLPLWSVAGTSLLNSYSVSFVAVPVRGT